MMMWCCTFSSEIIARILRQFWQHLARANNQDCCNTARWESLIAGALFAVHPIHTDAVANLFWQPELIVAAIGMAAFLLSIDYTVHEYAILSPLSPSLLSLGALYYASGHTFMDVAQYEYSWHRLIKLLREHWDRSTIRFLMSCVALLHHLEAWG